MAKEIDNDDLLEMLEAEEDDKQDSKVKDEEDGNVEDMKETKSSIDAIVDSIKSRDIDKISHEYDEKDLNTDYDEWINGVTVMPSADLNRFISNAQVKMSYGLSHSTLSNYLLMNKLKAFLDGAVESLFDPNSYLNMMPDELESRIKTAFTMYRELAQLNQRTTLALAEQARKYNSDTEMDKLSMLLSAIPSEKLSEILKEVNKAKKN